MVREGQAAVWGAARSGIAAANLLATLGARVALSDSRKQDALDVSRLDSRVELICGKNYIGDAKIVGQASGPALLFLTLRGNAKFKLSVKSSSLRRRRGHPSSR